MAPEHKFATAAKLCGEVLGGVADGLLPLEQCQEVLGDALRCLASKDIKVVAGIHDPFAHHIALPLLTLWHTKFTESHQTQKLVAIRPSSMHQECII